jgi:GAF domain-containing protein/HAMP domain-containing protein
MNQPNALQSDTEAFNERLARRYYSGRRYNPIFLGVAGLGFLAIFLLTQFGILGNAAPQLLYIGSLTLLFAIAEVPAITLAQQNKGMSASLLGAAVAGIFAILLTMFWQGIMTVAILIAAVTLLIVLRSRATRSFVLIHVIVFATIVGGILFVDALSPVDRLQNSTSAAIASIVFLTATGLLLVTTTVISQTRRFRSIQGLLLTSFIIIVTIPIVMTAVLSANGVYTGNQAETFNTLDAIATLKQDQIENLLLNFQKDSEFLLADERFLANSSEILNASGIDPMSQDNFKRLARLQMEDVLVIEEEAYNEIMVLNSQGDVVISTIPTREGSSFSGQPFFQRGLSGFYTGFAEEASFGTDNLIVAAPILVRDGQANRGVLVLRSNGAGIKGIMENTPGLVEAETYLVDASFKAVTKTHTPAELVRTQAASDAILNKALDGKAIYSNYAGQQVLGYYDWFEPMQLAVIAEVPLSVVAGNSVLAVAGSSLLALFVVTIAIAAVAVSARSIADPIRTLAQTTESLAAGNLSVRATVNRKDEIGALATAYNQMASQLQETIEKLEQRVASRTQDLENKTLRLRWAAEIVRDVAAARDVNELLTRAAYLIAIRFNFYHIGIFFLDQNKEYAVLVASPTEAGASMLENNYRIRVGDASIVGRVSASGEPRIATESGTELPLRKDSQLPNTRSEMALPLKVESQVIGVLDIHSDQPQAFVEDDITIMQVLVDQLATAIERTRLLQEVERNLRELENAYGQFTRDNWKRLTDNTATETIGYRFDNVRLERITELPDLASDAPTSGKAVNSNSRHSVTERVHGIAVPIRLRGQTIGVVNLKLIEGYDPETLSIVESAAERLASAMESARLYEEARLRADREQSISRVTSAIGASAGYEQILQNTVMEIGSILGDAEVAIQILEEPVGGKRTGGQGEQ